MVFPEYGKKSPPEDLDEMATVEHYRAKLKGKGDNIMYLNLAHKRCNR